MVLYFGKEGFNLNIFLRNRYIMGWALKEELLGNVIMDEIVFFVVLIVLYFMLELYSLVRKLILFFIEG